MEKKRKYGKAFKEDIKKVLNAAVQMYMATFTDDNHEADEIDVITEILKGMGYEYHEGQVMPNTPDIHIHHFISKDEKYILQVSLEEAEKDTVEAIRGD